MGSKKITGKKTHSPMYCTKLLNLTTLNFFKKIHHVQVIARRFSIVFYINWKKG